MQVKKQWTWTWYNWLVHNWKRRTQGYILSSCLFNLYAEYIMQNARVGEAQAGFKIAGRNSNNLQLCRRCYSNGRKWGGTKEPLDEGEAELKSWLRTQCSENKDHGIWSHHFMANRWGNSEGLFFWVPKSLQMVTAAMKLKDTCSLEEKLWQT